MTKHKVLSCLIQINDNLIFEHYKNHKEKDTLQHINSVTKSVLSILYGIAIKRGYPIDLDEPIYNYYPEYKDFSEDIQKQKITIRHLLTMTPGFDWPELAVGIFLAPYVFQEDPVGFILNRKLAHPPGTKMN